MTVEYTPAREVADLAKHIIKKHHPELVGERIEYVFRSEAASDKGKTVMGKARKVSGLNAYLAGDETGDGEPFFVIEIALDQWQMLSDNQRAALVDHELSHCGLTDEGAPKLIPHDLEEFTAIVQRHGLWQADVRSFVETASAQLNLLDGTP